MNQNALLDLRIKALQILSNRRLGHNLNGPEAMALLSGAGSLPAALVSLKERLREGRNDGTVAGQYPLPLPADLEVLPPVGKPDAQRKLHAPEIRRIHSHSLNSPPSLKSFARSDQKHSKLNRWAAALLAAARLPVRSVRVALRWFARQVTFRSRWK